MQHREKNFWLYVVAYICLGSSLVLILGAIAEFALFGIKANLGGAAGGLLIGTLLLSNLARQTFQARMATEFCESNPRHTETTYR